MKYMILPVGLAMTTASLAATDCQIPEAPDLSVDDMTQRQEQQLKRQMYRYLTAIEQFSVCVREEFGIARAAGADEAKLMRYVSQHNRVVSDSKEIVAAYEAEIGPVEELAELSSVARNRGVSGLSSQQPYEPGIGPNGPPPAPGTADWTPAGWARYIY